MRARVFLLLADRTGVASEVSVVGRGPLVDLEALDQVGPQLPAITVQRFARHLQSAHAHHRPRRRICAVVQQVLYDLVADAARGVDQRCVPTVGRRVDICSRSEQQREHLSVGTELARKVDGSFAVLVRIVHVALRQRKELSQHWQRDIARRPRPVGAGLAQLLTDGLCGELCQGLYNGRSIGVPPRAASSRAHVAGASLYSSGAIGLVLETRWGGTLRTSSSQLHGVYNQLHCIARPRSGECAAQQRVEARLATSCRLAEAWLWACPRARRPPPRCPRGCWPANP